MPKHKGTHKIPNGMPMRDKDMPKGMPPKKPMKPKHK